MQNPASPLRFATSCMRFAPLCVAALLLSSCILYRNDKNEPLDAPSIARLVPGTTTAQQALDLLGAPNDVIQLGNRSAWYYEYAQSKTAGFWALLVVLSGTDTRTDRLWLFFDENGILRHSGSTLAANRAGYSLPWSDPHGNVPKAATEQR
ncbi:MAG: outer membrane protein assembly factor BamE [Planctomycetes bacterium]|nr:outer membrane protein assembly factor BamE [Planctomycetota bacterium]